MATTAIKLGALYNQIFGVNGVRLEAIANAHQNAEQTTTKVDTLVKQKEKIQ